MSRNVETPIAETFLKNLSNWELFIEYMKRVT